MALYRPNYWNNYPAPFYADWKQEPIPGWGVRPVMAGPARVGVGALGHPVRDDAPHGHATAPAPSVEDAADPATAGALASLARWLPWVVGGGALVAITVLLVKAKRKR